MTESISQQERNWGMAAHLAALAMYTALPAGNVLGPLIIWLIKKEEMAFVNEQGKEALNFQLSMLIYMAVALFSCMLLIGFIILPALMVIHLVFIIVAAIEATKGLPYRYPFTIRFIR